MEYYRNLTYWNKYQTFFPKEYATDAKNAPEEECWVWEKDEIHIDYYESKIESPINVLLLHGAGGNGRMLAPYAQAIRGMGYNCMAPDLPGYGLTQSNSTDVNYETWVDCCVELVLSNFNRNQKPFVLVGASVGGMLAYNIAARIQSMKLKSDPIIGVIATTLADPRYPEVARGFAKFEMLNKILLPVLKRMPEKLLQFKIPIRWVTKMDKISNNKELSAIVNGDNKAGGSRTPLGFLLSIISVSPAVEPESFSICPVLLAHPELDHMTPVEWSMPFFDRLQGAKEFIELKGAGHFPVEPVGFSILEKGTDLFLKSVTDDYLQGQPLSQGLGNSV